MSDITLRQASPILQESIGEKIALWLHRIVIVLAVVMVFFPPFNVGRISANISGNLTLLTGFINRACQNDAFSVKRGAILEQAAGGTFIPLCTRKVFRKEFPGAGASLSWSESDKKAYTEDIIRFLCSFLKLEDTGHES